MKKLVLIFIFILVQVLLFGATAESLLKPLNTAYDFTYNTNTNLNTYQATQYANKVEMQVDKILGIVPRLNKIFDCKNDSFGNTYCPEALEIASKYTAYKASTTFERTGTVTDYEKGNYAEHTSTVRDFMDGFASSHSSNVIDYQSGSGIANVGTVVDYQSNSSSITYTGSVIDYTIKKCQGLIIGGQCYDSSISSATSYQSLTCVNKTIPCMPGSDECCTITISCSGGSSASISYYDCCGYRNTINVSDVNQFLSGINYAPRYGVGTKLVCNNSGSCSVYFQNAYCDGGAIGDSFLSNTFNITSKTEYRCNDNRYYTGSFLGADPTKCYLPKDLSCPTSYEVNGTNCQKTVYYNYYSYQCPNSYTPVNNGFTSYTKSDPDTSNINDYTLDDAVNSPTPPASNCKKTINYPYYNYNCPTGYTKANNGLTSCSKTDPNNTTYDEATLSQACNSSTPPNGNCTKIIPYTYYSYECSTGYTAIDGGMATCTKTDSSNTTDNSATLAQSCNSATPPVSNCYKDVSYKFYSYGCSSSYITDNYGLSICLKTDSNKNINNSDTLDDDCNSATPPDGNCRKSYSYKYYEYQCSGTNSFNEQWKPLNTGLTSCTKSDTNINAVNTDLATACNSSTAPVNNCAATEYSCNSAIFKPAYVDGNWKCSPFYCNSDMKCGYGSCDTFSVTDMFMPTSSNPLKSELISATSACSSTYEYSDGNVTSHYIKYCTTGQIDNAVCLEKDASNKCIKFETTNASAKCMLNGTAYEPSKQYTYYTYSCNTDTNTFGNSWELINNITSDPGCIDDTFGGCISFDKLSNSCKRKTLGCSNGGTCQYNSSVSQWQCMTGSVSVSNTTCTGKICDLVLNKNISYCANESCPTVNGIYEKNNKCYIMACPDGTYEQNGLCAVK